MAAEASLLYYPALALGGLIVGILATMSGVGGGVFMVPVFYFVLGLPISLAVGTSKAVVALITVWGGINYLARGDASLRRASILLVSMLPGSVAGAALVAYINARLVEILVGAFIVAYALNLARKTLAQGRSEAARGEERPAPGGRSSRPLLEAAVGLLAGLVAGLTGTGGGAILMPLLMGPLGMGVHEAAATSIVAISAGSVASGVVHVATGQVVYEVAVPWGLGALAGATLGPRIAARMRPRSLRLLISLVLLLAGGRMLLG